MTIGIVGPIDLKMLVFDFGDAIVPETNSFPLPTHLVNALLSKGHKVIVYTNSGSVTEPFVLQHEQLTVCVAPTLPKPGRRFFKFEVEELKKLMQQHPADVIHAFWTYEYALAAIGSGIPTIVGIHDVARRILLTQFDIFRFVRWCMNFKTLRMARYLAANSQYTYNQLSAKDKAKATIINNFYSQDLALSVPVPVQKQNCIATVTMGFTMRKGVPRALQAFAILRKQFPALEYLLIGADMELEGPAHQYARKHGIADGVRFLGPLPHQEVIQHVASSRVLVHPSVEESFGMAPLESMVVGTAVVGGEKSGFIPYLLDYGKAGLLCNVHSPQDMAATVRKLLTNNNFAQEIAQYAQRFARKNFSEEVVVQQHLDYLKMVYNRNGHSSEALNPVKEKAA